MSSQLDYPNSSIDRDGFEPILSALKAAGPRAKFTIVGVGGVPGAIAVHLSSQRRHDFSRFIYRCTVNLPGLVQSGSLPPNRIAGPRETSLARCKTASMVSFTVPLASREVAIMESERSAEQSDSLATFNLFFHPITTILKEFKSWDGQRLAGSSATCTWDHEPGAPPNSVTVRLSAHRKQDSFQIYWEGTPAKRGDMTYRAWIFDEGGRVLNFHANKPEASVSLGFLDHVEERIRAFYLGSRPGAAKAAAREIARKVERRNAERLIDYTGRGVGG